MIKSHQARPPVTHAPSPCNLQVAHQTDEATKDSVRSTPLASLPVCPQHAALPPAALLLCF